jgi:hypothetical protein
MEKLSLPQILKLLKDSDVKFLGPEGQVYSFNDEFCRIGKVIVNEKCLEDPIYYGNDHYWKNTWPENCYTSKEEAVVVEIDFCRKQIERIEKNLQDFLICEDYTEAYKDRQKQRYLEEIAEIEKRIQILNNLELTEMILFADSITEHEYRNLPEGPEFD